MTVHLLVSARAGRNDFIQLVPEGLEDIDCRSADGTRTFIQVKERAAGGAVLTVSQVADVLYHALGADPAQWPESVVLITDAELARGFTSSGWNSPLSECEAEQVAGVVAGLVRAGMTESNATMAIEHSRVVQLPWNLRQLSETELVTAMDLHPAVASIVVSELYSTLSLRAANQRATTRANALSIDLNDLESTAARVQSTVDLDGLQAAVAAGVCAPVSFNSAASIGPDQFYLGVDGTPAHIAARLDVPRASEMSQLSEAAATSRYALIVGPSGCGKSVLLWRAARDLIGGARVVRTHRVCDARDAELLLRHLQLLNPTTAAPVVVAADNLGRVEAIEWPNVIGRLLEIPNVIILGACRAEDYQPGLARGAVIVKPALDADTALEIAGRLGVSGLTCRMSASEALKRSEGLLMEYLTLLLQGRRMRQVLAEQAASLRAPGREVQRMAARLVTTAHALGFALPAGALACEVAPGEPPECVGDALAVLQDEHVVTTRGDSWTGLHELRSRILSEELHLAPPPSLGDTLQAVSRCLALPIAGWLLRRSAERFPEWTADLGVAIGERLADSGEVSADDLTQVLEGAERADSILYAHACLPELAKNRPRILDLRQTAFLAFAIGHQGLSRGITGEPVQDLVRLLRPVTGRLPDRAPNILRAVVAKLSAECVVGMAVSVGTLECVRLLEALGGEVRLMAADVARILEASPEPTDRESSAAWARLIDVLAPFLDEDNRDALLGSTFHRVEVLAKAEPWAYKAEVVGDTVRVTVLEALDDDVVSNTLPWEPLDSRSADGAEAIAIALAERLQTACPDSSLAAVTTRTPSGAILKVGANEFAQRCLSRAQRPDPLWVRRNVSFTAAVLRLSAFTTWTEAFEAQDRLVKLTLDLVRDARYRFKPNDNARRRSEWEARLSEARDLAEGIRPEPADVDDGMPRSHALADEIERAADPLSLALGRTLSALEAIIRNPNVAGPALLLAQATEALATVDLSRRLSAGSGEYDVLGELTNNTARLSKLAWVASREPSRLIPLRVHDDAAVDALMERAVDAFKTRQVDLWTSVLAGQESIQIKACDEFEGDAYALPKITVVVQTPEEDLPNVAELARQAMDTGCIGADSDVHLVPIIEGEARHGMLLVSRTPGLGLLATEPDRANRLALLTGFDDLCLPAESAAVEFAQEAVRVSWLKCLSASRPSSWGSHSRTAVPDLARLEAAARRLEDDRRVAREIGEILNQVRSEVADAATVCLAAIVGDARNGKKPDRDEEGKLLASLGRVLR